MNNLPLPPIDLSQVPTYVMAGGFLLAVSVLLLKIPQVTTLPTWQQGTIILVVVTAIGEGMLFLSTKLTPEVLAQLQPYWAQFLVGLGVVATLYGIQFGYTAIKSATTTWYDHKVTLRSLQESTAQAQLEVYNKIPARSMTVTPTDDPPKPGKIG